eukprot:CAMPEP_0118905726 /NCGR_PEP_ID=MMETSP1166-20130328/9590_1 /TAXON_ID=1104430 /ORGANISM="Chrysoreinhardia sp, Strain CCMP3193" /LENGTH=111 /DNA_ID=CAMNT_0006844997 /DNA_START=623 /DNA_END=955 /DNA_ORIENTATION=+
MSVHVAYGALGLFLFGVLDEGVALDEARPSVEVDVDVLDLAELAELVDDVVFLGLLVDVAHEDDPPLDGLDRSLALVHGLIGPAPADVGGLVARRTLVAPALELRAPLAPP